MTKIKMRQCDVCGTSVREDKPTWYSVQFQFGPNTGRGVWLDICTEQCLLKAPPVAREMAAESKRQWDAKQQAAREDYRRRQEQLARERAEAHAALLAQAEAGNDEAYAMLVYGEAGGRARTFQRLREEGWSLERIGKAVGLTSSRVSQILKKAAEVEDSPEVIVEP